MSTSQRAHEHVGHDRLILADALADQGVPDPVAQIVRDSAHSQLKDPTLREFLPGEKRLVAMDGSRVVVGRTRHVGGNRPETYAHSLALQLPHEDGYVGFHAHYPSSEERNAVLARWLRHHGKVASSPRRGGLSSQHSEGLGKLAQDFQDRDTDLDARAHEYPRPYRELLQLGEPKVGPVAGMPKVAHALSSPLAATLFDEQHPHHVVAMLDHERDDDGDGHSLKLHVPRGVAQNWLDGLDG